MVERSITNVKEITLDAEGKVLGRLATEAAYYLQGKHRPDYAPHQDLPQTVKITNAAKISVTGKKYTDKIYWRHSGYPGGIYSRTYEEVFKRDPGQVIRFAVRGMLPKNKLQARRMQRLIIEQ